MQELVDNFENYYKDHIIMMHNSKLNKFFNIDSISSLNFITEQNINTEYLIKKPKIMIIDFHEIEKQKYFIICNDNTIIIISESNIDLIKSFFIKIKEVKIIALSTNAYNFFKNAINQVITGNFQIFIEACQPILNSD